MFTPIEKVPIDLNFREAIVHAGNEVLMGVDINILLIVSNPQGFLDEQLRAYPIY